MDGMMGGVRILRVLLWTVIVLQLFVLSSGLKKGDKGVCEKEKSKSRTKFNRYSIKVRCPKGQTECTKKEKEAQHFNKASRCCKKKWTQKVNETECCDGWDYNVKEAICKPICSFGCIDGNCTAPGVCQCDLPRVLVGNNLCIQPVCDSPCINGICIANNTCKCEHDYKIVNKTHCAIECTSGYVNDPTTLDCVPKCDNPCANGTCTGPNTCTCFEGYKNKDNLTCVPDCTPTCQTNAECIAPNKCSCIEGYKSNDSSSICSPVCDECEHGRCIAPKKCECDKGYTKIKGKCVPICDHPCNHGVCSGPNICTCESGYKISHKNQFECLPKCEPYCVNASCVSPNTCVCYEGFKTAGSDWICKPKCDNCKNGECVKPNECQCHNFFTKRNGTCEPVCDKPCENGFCSEPNVCTCHPGYSLNMTDKFSCEPICEQTCVNATCTFPNTCSCLTGYEPTKDNHNICMPKCLSCSHGKCVAPNDCKCHEGYHKIKGSCEPVCNKACLNGFCSEPNVCTCNPGFSFNNTDKFSCEPICEQSCVNATCTSPKKCSCLTGYEPTEDSHICKPKCLSCLHGNCMAPDICECHEGYNMINGRCSPVCAPACINANCTSPNECTCIDGYEKKGTSTICHKPCINPCTYGVCSLNGICRCDPGYQLFNDTCTPTPLEDCKRCESNCTSGDLGECWCADGITRCEVDKVPRSEAYDTDTSLAGLELTWTLGGAVVLLLMTLLIVVMHRIYRKRQNVGTKDVDNSRMDRYGSVVYTVPDTLIPPRNDGLNGIDESIDGQDNDNDDDDVDNDHNCDVTKTDRLLTPELIIQDKKL